MVTNKSPKNAWNCQSWAQDGAFCHSVSFKQLGQQQWKPDDHMCRDCVAAQPGDNDCWNADAFDCEPSNRCMTVTSCLLMLWCNNCYLMLHCHCECVLWMWIQGSDSEHQLNVSMVISYNWQPSLCSADFTACQTVRVNACIEFFGPKALFPRSR